jgi:hypothetical protein
MQTVPLRRSGSDWVVADVRCLKQILHDMRRGVRVIRRPVAIGAATWQGLRGGGPQLLLRAGTGRW